MPNCCKDVNSVITLNYSLLELRICLLHQYQSYHVINDINDINDTLLSLNTPKREGAGTKEQPH